MARLAAPRSATLAPAALAGPVLGVLAVAAVLELLLLRSFTRTAIHVPDVQALEGTYTAAAGLGRYAYFVAATSLVAALVLLATILAGRRDPRGYAASIGAGVFILTAALVKAGEGATLLTLALSLAAVITAGAAATAQAPRRAAFIVPLTIAFAFAILYAMTQVTATGPGGTRYTWLHTAMEFPAVAAALAAPFAFGVPLRGRNLVLGALAAVVVFGIFAGNPSTSRILLLWNQGLSGALPGVAYALAAGAAAAALYGVVRAGRWTAAVALLLVGASGVGIENTYQTGLLVCALLLLALPVDTARKATR